MSDYAAGRNNPIEGIDSAELNALLTSVASAFEVAWLAEPSGGNRLQVLWSRQDGLTTNQLAILGDALDRLTPMNGEWIARRVEAIKSETATNRKGDLFELLGLSLFAVDGQRVVGAPEGNPGYDGTIDFGGGVLAQISLKDFGSSSHRKLFEVGASSIKQMIASKLSQLRATGLGVRIASSRYPLQADWEALRRAIDAIVSGWFSDPSPREIRNIWTLTPQPLHVDPTRLADGYASYSLTMLAPLHANEQSNIESKIEDACVNLARKAKECDPHWARFLLIRIPKTASPALCSACARRWLQDRPEARVDGVILYQPMVAAASVTGPNGIVHFIEIITGPGFEHWRQVIG